MASLSTNSSSLRTWLLAAAASLALLGCGGGDGGTDTSGGGTGGGGSTVQILDSFGQVVQAGGADGVGVGDSGADGTAGEGKPIVGGTVTVTDVNGKSVSATTDAQGYYRVKITGFTAPFVAKVTKADGTALRSINIKAPVTNAFITLNLSGLTDKVASDVAKAGGKSGAADLTPAIVAANTSAIATSINNLASAIAPVLSAAGIDSKSFDPLATPFRPNAQGYDFVLDNVKVTVDSSGATVVTVSPTFNGGTGNGLQGNWQLMVTAEGVTTVGGTVPASAVPSATIVTQATSATAATYLAPTSVSAGGSTYTITTNGNTTTITGPGTNFVLTINSFSFTNYQGCGSCGVGTSVSVQMNANYTAGGTMDGQTIPTTTASLQATLSWKRVN